MGVIVGSAGAKPPPQASGASKRAGRRNAQSKRAGRRNAQRNAQRNALVLPEKQYQHHNRHWYCQHQV